MKGNSSELAGSLGGLPEVPIIQVASSCVKRTMEGTDRPLGDGREAAARSPLPAHPRAHHAHDDRYDGHQDHQAQDSDVLPRAPAHVGVYGDKDRTDQDHAEYRQYNGLQDAAHGGPLGGRRHSSMSVRGARAQASSGMRS